VNTLNRRHFLFATPAACGLACAVRAADPVARPGPAHFKLSLAAYSFRKYLELKPKKPIAEPMTIFQFAEYCASLGLGAVEPTSYYFAETTPAYLAKFKHLCTRLGLDVSGTAVGNDFCQADDRKRAADVAKVKRWVEIAGYLGAKTIRVFAGKTPKDDTEEAARKRCVEALPEVCDHGAKHGVMIALENHGGITETADQLLAIVSAVKHDWLGVNLDTGNFKTADPYADFAKAAPYAVTVQFKTEVHPAGQPKKSEADFARLFGILKEAGYRGYVALEYEGEEEPKTAVPRYLTKLRSSVPAS
jgi:sugar phosphate isomerase/epimerase